MIGTFSLPALPYGVRTSLAAGVSLLFNGAGQFPRQTEPALSLYGP